MEEKILQKLEAQQKQLDAVYISLEKIRKYFKWTLVITVLTIVLPLIVVGFALPWLINILTSSYSL